ncbi:7TM diverse intracellular signaling domain-containing protein [Bernardetia sp. OM2101]|uniref:7TM diverse intracellular signaling domain-containing protein n=1 Tax=Bernardetia sp. OM2101 TaxID=3344876 RepID=UPI0035CFBEB8
MLDSSEYGYAITSKLGLFEEKASDKHTIQTIQNVDFVVEGKEIINLNNGVHTLWLKIPIQNNSQRTQWYIEAGSGLVNIQAFIPTTENPTNYKQINLGHSLPYESRIFKTDRFLIPVEIPPNRFTTIYIRLESDYFQAPFHIAPLKYYFERDHKVDLAEGLYYGFVLVMFLYNLFVYFTLKERGYLYYVGYLFFFGLAMAQVRGHGFEFIWSKYYWLNQYVPILHSLSGVFASLFLIDFLHTKRYSLFFHRTLQVVISIFSIAIIIGILGYKSTASLINQTTVGLSVFNALFAAIFIYYKGYNPAKYIIVAWSAYLIGVFLFVLAGAGIIPYTTITSGGILFGSAIEMVLLSVALAAKIDFYKKEKEQVQKQMFEESEKHRAFVETQNKRLEERVVERTEELNVVNEELSVNLERLHEQNIVIEKKNQDITASITYAKRIQNAMLPRLEEIESVFPNSFVFFEPRDIVSGDFYYFKQINKKVILGAIDCTGHGVPGAFMSLIGNDLLNEIIENKTVTQASHILDKLDEGITKVLRQTDTQVRDGMDAAFCVYDIETQIMEYAGARNPLIYIEDDELKIIKADRKSIGGNFIKNQLNKKYFTNHVLNTNETASFYLFTDGFQDQFGGKEDKKFTTKRFRNVLLEVAKLPFSHQQEFLKNTLKNWMGYTNRQIDDILVFGFKVGK